ncbi:MAG: amidohydrolase [Thermoplasmata archaeon YP2-bin.285]|uniref:Amidohydrolase n=1 Tax=Candidatus Sysuiplasma superficiale TaxID=2823368 RepID=A0A8J8CFU9_9ARCH|nr:amidohydrolase [Candidatus Sysuiplasma superficiale]
MEKENLRELERQVLAIVPECIELRRKLHSHPELSLNEHGTASEISMFLRKHGLSAGSYDFPSVVCDIGSKPRMAIRADMDALPVDEASGEAFASEVRGVMHACGHDAHSSILAGAGIVLNQRGKADVRLLFQPAEEVGKGAKMMIGAGALDGVERVFGLHVWPSLDTGTVAILDGPAMSAPDEFSITVKGKGGHGAYPHLTPDTILASSSIITQFNWLVSRRVDPLSSAVISFGELRGGNAHNVIPAEVQMKGTMRTFDADVKGRLVKGMTDICDSTGRTFGLDVKIDWINSGPAVINDAEFAGKCRTVADTFMKSVPCNPTMGSEDFAYYLQKAKGAFAFLGTGKDEATRASKHSSKFRLDEEAIYYGIMLEVLVAEEFA